MSNYLLSKSVDLSTMTALSMEVARWTSTVDSAPKPASQAHMAMGTELIKDNSVLHCKQNQSKNQQSYS